MSMMVSFVLSFFPRDVLDEILNLIESVSEDFPSYSYFNILMYNKDLDIFIENYIYLFLRPLTYLCSFKLLFPVLCHGQKLQLS